MNTPLTLARASIRSMHAYQPASGEKDLIRLHANEAPWRAPGDHSDFGLNRYPEPQPKLLADSFSALYGVQPTRLLMTRGSDDAIDLLIRTFCEAGRDEIMICPPTFDMYRIWAQIQGAGVVECPLDQDRGFALRPEQLVAQWRKSIKLIFLCSPNNPTGNCMPVAAVEQICQALAGKAMVVVDEAYMDFSSAPSLTPLLDRYPNLVLLRTLSKAYALAALRLGVLLGHEDLIDLTRRLLPPYPLPAPAIEAALGAVEEREQERLAERIAELRAEKDRVIELLGRMPFLEELWPSDANFVLIRVREPARILDACCRNGVLIRDFSEKPLLERCLRVTIGSRMQNDRLLAALEDA